MVSPVLLFSRPTCATKQLELDSPPPPHLTRPDRLLSHVLLPAAAINKRPIYLGQFCWLTHPNYFAGGMFILDRFTLVYAQIDTSAGKESASVLHPPPVSIPCLGRPRHVI